MTRAAILALALGLCACTTPGAPVPPPADAAMPVTKAIIIPCPAIEAFSDADRAKIADAMAPYADGTAPARMVIEWNRLRADAVACAAPQKSSAKN